jgi:hypothetical protein
MAIAQAHPFTIIGQFLLCSDALLDHSYGGSSLLRGWHLSCGGLVDNVATFCAFDAPEQHLLAKSRFGGECGSLTAASLWSE